VALVDDFEARRTSFSTDVDDGWHIEALADGSGD
jgi:hypothetical protein